MRTHICIWAAVLFLNLRAEVNAQDVLSIFFDREAASSIIGGNPFAPPDPRDSAFTREGSRAATPSAQMDSWIDNIYRETRPDGREQELQRNADHAGIQIPLTVETTTSLLRIEYQSTKMYGAFEVDPKDNGYYNGADEYVAAGLTVPLSDGVDCSIALQKNTQENGIAPGYQFGFSYQSSEGNVTLKIRDLPRLQFLTLDISEVGGILPLDYVQKGGEVEFTAPVGRMSIRISGHFDYLSPLPQFTRANDSHFAPDGSFRGIRATAILALADRVSALCSFGMEAVEGNGNFYSQSSPYGSFNSFLFENDFFQTGVRYGAGQVDFVSDLKFSVMSGAATGFAESWPFADISQSSFSQGRFDGSGNIRMLQAHTGATFPLFERLRMGAGINVVQLVPDLHLDTWQTNFLSIGEKDLQTLAFSYREIDGMILSGGLSGNIGASLLTYSFSQMIPLRIVAAANVNPAGVNAPTASPRTGRSSGGQFHQITLLLHL